MERKAALEYINNRLPDAFLKKAKKRGYICPSCGNGTGRDGDGIVKNPKSGKYKCFKCGLGGDIIDLIGIAFGMNDFNECLKKGAELYGITLDRYKDSSTQTKQREGARRSEATNTFSSLTEKNVTEYIKRCHLAVKDIDYFNQRGISPENVEKFWLGYDPAYDEGNVGGHPWRAAIIPTSPFSYEARNIDVKPDSTDNGKNKYRKHGETRIFNSSSLREANCPVVICEGIFDALSVMECGGQAVALGSVSNYRLLLLELERCIPSKPLVIVLDNDDRGKATSKILKAELDSRKIPALLSQEIVGRYHDINERLLQDKEGLVQALNNVYNNAKTIAEISTDKLETYRNMSAGASLHQFIDAIRAGQNTYRRSSGLTDIDRALGGGICPGLYVIGGISSLGKTTLTLQIADGLAAQGTDVLYFSLEQSRYELMSKSISRETFVYCLEKHLRKEKARSHVNILDGSSMSNPDYTDILVKAMDAYQSYAKNIYIFEGVGNITVSEIRRRVQEHISLTGNIHPVIFIDYLQVLKAEDEDRHASDKQIVDHNITALKQLSRDYNIPVIVVSSLNRANYTEKINMSAYKESGAIEYGADVLIGLQFTGVGTSGFDIDSAKTREPRLIDFCILKNRNGQLAPSGINMEFYAAYNYFVSSSEKKHNREKFL